MLITNKISWPLRILLGMLVSFIFVAIFFGARGDTFEAAKAALKAKYELDVLEANYLFTIRGRHIEIALPNVFYNQASRYSMRYPGNWETANSGSGIFVINGKEGTPSFYSNVNIQAIRTQQSGGTYVDARDFINSLKKQAGNASNIRVVETGPITLYLLDSTPVEGEYVIFTYSISGLAFKQWQVAIKRSDGRVLYVWAYNAPLVRFQSDYPTAKAMLKSFNFF